VLGPEGDYTDCLSSTIESALCNAAPVDCFVDELTRQLWFTHKPLPQELNRLTVLVGGWSAPLRCWSHRFVGCYRDWLPFPADHRRTIRAVPLD
jgi:hypothetical protein